MHPDVENLIQEYWIQMTILQGMLEAFQKKYHYLEDVQFQSLDDIVAFTNFMSCKLKDVHMIQFLGTSPCQCQCHRDCFLWVCTHSLLNDRVMTMENVLEFIEGSDMVCQHERVCGFVVEDQTIHVLVKRRGIEVNGRARETIPAIEAKSQVPDD